MTTADEDAALHCPLCNYSLRGLVDPRCPECGFAFEWAELRETARNKHPYLFEHGAGHNLRTFWLTFWRDCRPRKFWRDLSPAHPIRLRRLVVYWVISNLAFLLFIPAVFFTKGVPLALNNAAKRVDTQRQIIAYLAMPRRPFVGWRLTLPTTRMINAYYPPLFSGASCNQLFDSVRRIDFPFGMYMVGLTWPTWTLLTLLIFQGTMRRANIRNVHVLRTVIYSADLPLVLAICVAVIATGFAEGGWAALLFCGFSSVLCYRLYFAFRRYLRFDWPLATVIASQVIVGLFVLTVLSNVPNGWLFQSP